MTSEWIFFEESGNPISIYTLLYQYAVLATPASHASSCTTYPQGDSQTNFTERMMLDIFDTPSEYYKLAYWITCHDMNVRMPDWSF